MGCTSTQRTLTARCARVTCTCLRSCRPRSRARQPARSTSAPWSAPPTRCGSSTGAVQQQLLLSEILVPSPDLCHANGLSFCQTWLAATCVASRGLLGGPVLLQPLLRLLLIAAASQLCLCQQCALLLLICLHTWPAYLSRTCVNPQPFWCDACRFTLDELEGFLETAKECIPGVKEAIVSANSHKAHRVQILCLPHLLSAPHTSLMAPSPC